MKKLIFSILILNSILSFGQGKYYNGEAEPTDSMQRAWFPYQIIDSLILPDNYSVIIVSEDIYPLIEKAENHKTKSILIQNSTDKTISFPEQDKSMICVLEATNQSNEWKPIQYWWVSWCGNSFSKLDLNPNQTIHLAINNMLGEIETSMRIRIHGDDKIFVSDEFYGRINEKSFLIPENIKSEMEEAGRFTYLDSPQVTLPGKFEIGNIQF